MNNYNDIFDMFIKKIMEKKQYLVTFKCPECYHMWEDITSIECTGECPNCDLKNVEPLDYEVL